MFTLPLLQIAPQNALSGFCAPNMCHTVHTEKFGRCPASANKEVNAPLSSATEITMTLILITC